MRNGVTLEQVAGETKISLRFLCAIESEDYGELPGGIFNTSYIRQYAAAIGFDEEALLARYHASGNDKNPELPYSKARRPPSAGRKPPSPLSWFRVLSPIRFH